MSVHKQEPTTTTTTPTLTLMNHQDTPTVLLLGGCGGGVPGNHYSSGTNSDTTSPTHHHHFHLRPGLPVDSTTSVSRHQTTPVAVATLPEGDDITERVCESGNVRSCDAVVPAGMKGEDAVLLRDNVGETFCDDMNGTIMTQDDVSDGMPRRLERVAQDGNLREEAIQVLKESAASLGVLLRFPLQNDVMKVAPLTLFPTVVPQHAIDAITDLQGATNLLMHRVSHDRHLLTTCLGPAASVDPFIRSLLAIHAQIDVDNQWELGLIRSDYILSQGNASSQGRMAYKQVEVNMIAVGMVGLGGKVGLLHERVQSFLDESEQNSNIRSTSASTGEPLTLYGEGLRIAYGCYRMHCKVAKKRPPILLIVVQEAPEQIVLDQRFVQTESGVPSLRRSFAQISASGRLDEDGCLFVEDREVAVVYYRTGYSPNQYKNNDWETRLLIEKSTAIKCPSVAHQLSGFKKIQQVLSRPEILLRYIPDTDTISRLRQTYMGQWDVSEPESQSKLEEALSNPDRFVLKPNREGGGNNFYGEDLVVKLKEVLGSDKAPEYILMELIDPVMQENYFIRPDKEPERLNTISEVSVFGVILAKNEQVVLNKSSKEIIVRVKSSSSYEGAICTGHACYGSVVSV
ncbi:Glutathione synthetase [Hypsibius exemplaris]|uniref:Glutathione synthetase n=1 Tax=Hypsibius exemplaris TaxID=2072580 RepID=A0A1W0X2W1_HYPEX|nr:Glutathione synthetase [Hypsibius exemplaris]